MQQASTELLHLHREKKGAKRLYPRKESAKTKEVHHAAAHTHVRVPLSMQAFKQEHFDAATQLLGHPPAPQLRKRTDGPGPGHMSHGGRTFLTGEPFSRTDPGPIRD
jgi:hypothetical protein